MEIRLSQLAIVLPYRRGLLGENHNENNKNDIETLSILF